MLAKSDPEIIKTVERLRYNHRQRRFIMKLQAKLDRSLESYVRINKTNWHPDMDEKERKKFNDEVKIIIDNARVEYNRKGDITKQPQGDDDVVQMVQLTDAARLPADKRRSATEKLMEMLAMQLPVWSWVQTIDGVGALGLGTIIAETGDLSNYTNVGKLWKRLMFAPYDGFAGSTWKRGWGPRTLTAEEWIENPFSGRRYALMVQIATWLVNNPKQIEGKVKSGTKHGKPKGYYGEVYVKRRLHTDVTHPDWTPGHARADALRYTMKRFLKHLWQAWRKQKPSDVHKVNVPRKR